MFPFLPQRLEPRYKIEDGKIVQFGGKASAIVPDQLAKNYRKTYPYTNLVDAVNALNAEKAKTQTIAPVEVKPVYSSPSSFQEALANYSLAFSAVMANGIQNLSPESQKQLNKFAVQVRDFDSKDLGPGARQVIQNISDAESAINAYSTQNDIVSQKAAALRRMGDPKRREAAAARLETERDSLLRLRNAANQLAPRISESFTRVGLSDIMPQIGQTQAAAPNIGAALEGLASGTTTAGLGAASALGGASAPDTGATIPSQLSATSMFQTGDLAGKLNSQVTDEQILSDINTARQARYKNLYDIGTAAITNIQSQIESANKFLSTLPEGDRRRTTTQDAIKKLTTELATVQSDTVKAGDLYNNYQPVSGDQAGQLVSRFRESLRLPEERTLQQIKEIDPQLYQSLSQIGKGYQEMAAQPIGPTTAPQTEALRQQVEQEALNQLRLGSTIGQEERRGYEQAVRAAQTARGNIFGLGPAVQEAAQIGALGEQRKLARYGAAAQFLGSGQTMSDALARDVSLRNALEQSRLGAASQFAAGGPSLYGMASQRLGQQQAAIGGMLAASTPQPTPGFQAQPSAMTPYAYVDPMAGFRGAQTGAQIYGDLARYQADTYGAYSRAVASQPSFGQQFANIAGGLSGFSGFFGAPGSSAFFRA